MKKALYLLFAILLLAKLNSADKCYHDESKLSCDKRELDDVYYRCCKMEYKIEGTKSEECIPVTKDQYKKIKDTIKEYKNKAEIKVEDVEIDCSSNYMIISLLTLISLLL